MSYQPGQRRPSLADAVGAEDDSRYVGGRGPGPPCIERLGYGWPVDHLPGRPAGGVLIEYSRRVARRCPNLLKLPMRGNAEVFETQRPGLEVATKALDGRGCYFP